MRKSHFSPLVGILFIFVLSIALFAGVYSLSLTPANAPKAEHGLLDLTKWDFDKEGVISLNGNWTFYKDRLLDPEALGGYRSPEAASIDLPVPQSWSGDPAPNQMSKKGFGTYHLEILVPGEERIYGIKVNNIRMSHRLYLNGRLLGESGDPASEAERHTPGNTPYTAYFNAKGPKIDIVIQTANFVFVNGGIVNAIQFGRYEDINTLSGIQLGSSLGTILVLGMFGIYHISFYLLRRKEKPYLYSGMYLLNLLVTHLLLGEKIALRFLPELPFMFAYKTLEFSEFLGPILINIFFFSIEPKLMSRRRLLLLISPLIAYLLAVLILPYPVFIDMKVYGFQYLAVVTLFLFGRMVYLFLRKEQADADRKELILFIGSVLSLGIYLVFSVLYAEYQVRSELFGFLGILGFIIFMNILLALRFTNAYEKTEVLTHQLKLSNRLKDEFLTHTSHELKTPLHGIMNITSHLLDDEEKMLTSRQKQNLWLIKDTSLKLSMLIQDLIDVTRLNHGELRLYPTAVDLKVVAQIVLEVLQFELHGKPVQFINDVDADIWVMADENRLRQILYNLVQNAIKHTDAGYIKIQALQTDSAVLISVEDTGTGIPVERHETIFNDYGQLDAFLTQEEYTHEGLGLYISRKLVELMDGEIYVEWSLLDMGSRFTFTLPAVEHFLLQEGTNWKQTAASREEIDNEPLDIMNQYEHTVLIVDDEVENIHTLRSILNRNQYNVITAFSADEAMLKLSSSSQIDLAIIDMMMPKVSGIELSQLVRAQYSILDLPILFATAKDSTKEIALGLRAGANDFITKPFETETLMARVQNLISMKKAIREAIQNELAFHQAQIKPHFLYNALSSVISFCYTDGEKAADLLSMLSQYLRYILDMDRTRLFVPLHRELELIDAYVEIEKARFGERFDYIAYVDDALLDVEIPSLCIQPLVENAIRHGLFEKEGYGHVTLKISEGDQYIKITVEDDGTGIADDRLYYLQAGNGRNGGIGLHNIKRRIASIPGSSLSIHSELGSGTQVTMYLPMKQEESHDEL
ncbi:sensor histidine kinase [Paenibacillus guangzhouensis]|uniref:sensor histidine kinase n=1 Tax=Paenibacillus guangzhouensis TaxID=1473112 RepID=UPI001D1231C7|nr:ATP-binding protein [Paenibacillus guangzhouensis]